MSCFPRPRRSPAVHRPEARHVTVLDVKLPRLQADFAASFPWRSTTAANPCSACCPVTVDSAIPRSWPRWRPVGPRNDRQQRARPALRPGRRASGQQHRQCQQPRHDHAGLRRHWCPHPRARKQNTDWVVALGPLRTPRDTIRWSAARPLPNAEAADLDEPARPGRRSARLRTQRPQLRLLPGVPLIPVQLSPTSGFSLPVPPLVTLWDDASSPSSGQHRGCDGAVDRPLPAIHLHLLGAQ